MTTNMNTGMSPALSRQFEAIRTYVHGAPNTQRLVLQDGEVRCVSETQSTASLAQRAIANRVVTVMQQYQTFQSTTDPTMSDLITASTDPLRLPTERSQAVRDILFPHASLPSTMSSSSLSSSSSSSQSSSSLSSSSQSSSSLSSPTPMATDRPRITRPREEAPEEAETGHRRRRARIEPTTYTGQVRNLLGTVLPPDLHTLVQEYAGPPDTLRGLMHMIPTTLSQAERRERFKTIITDPAINVPIVNQLFDEADLNVVKNKPVLRQLFTDVNGNVDEGALHTFIYDIFMGIIAQPSPEITIVRKLFDFGTTPAPFLAPAHVFLQALCGGDIEKHSRCMAALSQHVWNFMPSDENHCRMAVEYVCLLPQEERIPLFLKMITQPGGNPHIANFILRESGFSEAGIRQNEVLQDIFGSTNNTQLRRCTQSLYDNRLKTLQRTDEFSNIQTYIWSLPPEQRQNAFYELLTQDGSDNLVKLFLIEMCDDDGNISYEQMKNNPFLRELCNNNETTLNQLLVRIFEEIFKSAATNYRLLNHILADPEVGYNVDRISHSTLLTSLFTINGDLDAPALTTFINTHVVPNLSQLGGLNLEARVTDRRFIDLCTQVTELYNTNEDNISEADLADMINRLPLVNDLDIAVHDGSCLGLITEPERILHLEVSLPGVLDPHSLATLMFDIGRFTQLQSLTVAESPGQLLTDTDLQYLLSLTELDYLNLSGQVQLTDACIDTLLQLPSLETVDLNDCDNLSLDGVNRLRARGINVLIDD